MLVVKCPFGIWKVPFSAMTKTMPSSSHSQSRIADGLLAAGCRSVQDADFIEQSAVVLTCI